MLGFTVNHVVACLGVVLPGPLGLSRTHNVCGPTRHCLPSMDDGSGKNWGAASSRPVDGARASLLVTGSSSLIASLPATCREMAQTNELTGVAYKLSDSGEQQRLEIIAEGTKANLEPLTTHISDAASAESAH